MTGVNLPDMAGLRKASIAVGFIRRADFLSYNAERQVAEAVECSNGRCKFPMADGTRFLGHMHRLCDLQAKAPVSMLWITQISNC